MWSFLLEPQFGPFTHLANVLGFANTNFLWPHLIFPSLIVIVIWEWTGYNMVILYTALKSVPRELIEAAVLDRTPMWKIVLKVKLPMVRPAIVLLAFLNVIGALQLFTEPIILAYSPAAISNYYTPVLYLYNTAIGGPAVQPRRGRCRAVWHHHCRDLSRVPYRPEPERRIRVTATTIDIETSRSSTRRRSSKRAQRAPAAPVSDREAETSPSALWPEEGDGDARHLARVLFAVFTLIPIAWIVINSTKTQSNIFSSRSGSGSPRRSSSSITSHLLFQDVDGDGTYIQWLGNTALYAGLGGVGATALSTFAGYGFARFHFRGSKALFYFVIAALLVPIAAITLPLYFVYAKVGLINSIWGMVLPSMVSPVGVYLMKVFIDASVPQELMDAARWTAPGNCRIFTGSPSPSWCPG